MEPGDDFHIYTSIPSVNPDGTEQVFRPEWRTETVVGLARGIVEDGAFARMPILADALEEAGCDLPSVLFHCREPIAHNADCWVLERILCRVPPPSSVEAEEWLREYLRRFEWMSLPPSPGRFGLLRLALRRFAVWTALNILMFVLSLVVFGLLFVGCKHLFG